jgi:hypothetical protein
VYEITFAQQRQDDCGIVEGARWELQGEGFPWSLGGGDRRRVQVPRVTQKGNIYHSLEYYLEYQISCLTL